MPGSRRPGPPRSARTAWWPRLSLPLRPVVGGRRRPVGEEVLPEEELARQVEAGAERGAAGRTDGPAPVLAHGQQLAMVDPPQAEAAVDDGGRLDRLHSGELVDPRV